jgi:hypothetical protein
VLGKEVEFILISHLGQSLSGGASDISWLIGVFLNDIVGIIFVIESALESNPILILNDIFGVFLVVGDLDESSLPASVLFMMSSVFRYLSIVAFVVLVEPTIVIALGGKLGIVELFVIVADSVHVFGGIGDLGVVRRGLVRGRITM